jgi:hypothetical protein
MFHKNNVMWHRQKKLNKLVTLTHGSCLSPTVEWKLNLEHTYQDENLDSVSPQEAHTRILFQTNVCYDRRSEGRKLEERVGGKVTGTVENQNGGISALTAQKHVSEIWHNFLFNSEYTVQNLCRIWCIADFEGTEALGNHGVNFLWHFSYSFFFNVGFHNEYPSYWPILNTYKQKKSTIHTVIV